VTVRADDAFAALDTALRAAAMTAYMRDQFPFLGIPALTAAMDEWIEPDDIWLARTALPHRPHYRAADRDFFVPKAIGWARREYSKTDVVAVRRFVSSHAHVLAPLSVREATEGLDRRGAA